jgi:hypothetical protein
MPSHTFTRVGYWKESVESNIASEQTALKENVIGEVLHAMDYQAYAYLQMAQDVEARRVADEARTAAQRLDPNATGAAAPGVAGVYATAAIPARYALERGAWAEAATLSVRPSTPAADAITHFTRAMGALRSGNKTAAQADIEQLDKLHETLAQAKQEYWAEQVDIQRRAARAWVALAGRGRRRRPLRTAALGAGYAATIAAINAIGLGPIDRDLSGPALRRGLLRGMTEVLRRFGVDARYVLCGHSHRSGPWPGDDLSEWTTHAGGRLVNAGSWVYQEHFLTAEPNRSPYWPGTAVVIEDSGPPQLLRLLGERGHEELRPRA